MKDLGHTPEVSRLFSGDFRGGGDQFIGNTFSADGSVYSSNQISDWRSIRASIPEQGGDEPADKTATIDQYINHIFPGTFNAGRDAAIGNTMTINGNVQNFTPEDSLLHIRAAITGVLKFDGIAYKESRIVRDTSNAFRWVWRTGFSEWLKSDRSIFWITGKPGSGKSTLLKKLSEAGLTRQILEKAGGSWQVLYFPFHYHYGRETANSASGMLRSLLLQMCSLSDPVAKAVHESQLLAINILDSVEKLLELISKASQRSDTRFCVFIDGLDEYRDDLPMLMHRLFELQERTGMKMCLASRYVAAVETRMRDVPFIIMQEHNDESIANYLNGINDQVAADLGCPCDPEVINNIINKANGVILWARLAFENVLEGCNMRESKDELHQRLERLPAKVQELYANGLERVPKAHVVEAATYLMFIDNAKASISVQELIQLSRAAQHQRPMLIKAPDQMTRLQFEYRLSGLLGALVVVKDAHTAAYIHANGDTPRFNSFESIQPFQLRAVEIVHETMHKYLHESSWCSSILTAAAIGSCRDLFGEQIQLVLATCGQQNAQVLYRFSNSRFDIGHEGGRHLAPKCDLDAVDTSSTTHDDEEHEIVNSSESNARSTPVGPSPVAMRQLPFAVTFSFVDTMVEDANLREPQAKEADVVETSRELTSQSHEMSKSAQAAYPERSLVPPHILLASQLEESHKSPDVQAPHLDSQTPVLVSTTEADSNAQTSRDKPENSRHLHQDVGKHRLSHLKQKFMKHLKGSSSTGE